MCRMYGFLATHATRLECSLVEAQNALHVQSDRDARGIRNADGWGIAHWDGDDRSVFKSTMPAFADDEFVEVASSIWSDAAIAHVRAATVGGVSEENTHPFTLGTWAFAHNGHIPASEHLVTRLDYGPYGPPDGETDSEAAFVWILNRMERYGLDVNQPAPGIEPVVALIEDAVLELVDLSILSGSASPPSLNFLMSDGRHLVASRWGRSLYWSHRRGIRDCGVCGLSHCPSADDTYRSVAIASEPITDETWHEIPDGSVIGVDVGARTVIRDLIGEQLAV